ncbi:hypothetical protein [Streptomyces sp. NPDC008092]|uniref:hypothetical protein n=1 Tax=Streptomyces sp. NPDC008092 TaxID=3364808 RepID=UPI0036EEFE3F
MCRAGDAEQQVERVVRVRGQPAGDGQQETGQFVAGRRDPVSPPAAGISAGMRYAYVADPEGNLLEPIETSRA